MLPRRWLLSTSVCLMARHLDPHPAYDLHASNVPPTLADRLQGSNHHCFRLPGRQPLINHPSRLVRSPLRSYTHSRRLVVFPSARSKLRDRSTSTRHLPPLSTPSLLMTTIARRLNAPKEAPTLIFDCRPSASDTTETAKRSQTMTLTVAQQAAWTVTQTMHLRLPRRRAIPLALGHLADRVGPAFARGLSLGLCTAPARQHASRRTTPPAITMPPYQYMASDLSAVLRATMTPRRRISSQTTTTRKTKAWMTQPTASMTATPTLYAMMTQSWKQLPSHLFRQSRPMRHRNRVQVSSRDGRGAPTTSSVLP